MIFLVEVKNGLIGPKIGSIGISDASCTTFDQFTYFHDRCRFVYYYFNLIEFLNFYLVKQCKIGGIQSEIYTSESVQKALGRVKMFFF